MTVKYRDLVGKVHSISADMHTLNLIAMCLDIANKELHITDVQRISDNIYDSLNSKDFYSR